MSVVATANSIGRNVLDMSYPCTNSSSANSKSNGINGLSKSKKNSSNGNINNSSRSKNKSSNKVKGHGVKSTGLLMVAPQQTLTGQIEQNSSVGGRGPRVKRVCRTIATGLPRATFSSRDSDDDENVDGDEDEDEETTDHSSDDSSSSSVDSSSDDDEEEENDDGSSASDSDALPVTEYIIRAFERETQNTSKSGITESASRKKQKKKTNGIAKEKGKNGKKSNKLSASTVTLKAGTGGGINRSSGISNSSNKKVTINKKKKQGQQQKVNSCQKNGKRNKTDFKSSPSKKSTAASSSNDSSKLLTSPVKKVIKKRCGICNGCTASDCGLCTFCLDKKKFGGPNIIKQACKLRKCIQMTSPQQ